MKVQFSRDKSIDDQIDEYIDCIRRDKANIFIGNKDRNEVVAIISSGGTGAKYYWVWLSNDDTGPFCGGVQYSVDAIAKHLCEKGFVPCADATLNIDI